MHFIHATKDTGSVCPSILSEPTEMKSFLKTELQLTLGGTKEPQQSPPPLLSCVLQALTIQGELQHKIKLFSKTQCPVNQSVNVFLTVKLTESNYLNTDHSLFVLV